MPGRSSFRDSLPPMVGGSGDELGGKVVSEWGNNGEVTVQAAEGREGERLLSYLLLYILAHGPLAALYSP